MRYTLALLLLWALATVASAADPGTKELLDRVAALARAFRDADVEQLSTMISPEYVHTNNGSKSITREQWLSYVKTRREEIRSGALHVEQYENRELEARIHGDTAVVTGVNFSSGTRSGQPFTLELRFTQVWRRENGVWLRIAFHDAPLAR